MNIICQTMSKNKNTISSLYWKIFFDHTIFQNLEIKTNNIVIIF